MTKNIGGKQKLRLGTHKYLEIRRKNQFCARTVRKLLDIVAEKRKLILAKRKNSIKDLKNKIASKKGVVFHVMVTEAPF